MPVQTSTINLFSLNVAIIDHDALLQLISQIISLNKKKCISYANAHVLNSIYRNIELRDRINSIDLVHPDGVGIFLASRFIYGPKGLKKRFVGSDFYPLLAREAEKNQWKIFFFGHDDQTLNKIHGAYPGLNICGLNEGYNFDKEELIGKINNCSPNLLIVGLSHPLQENWLFENHVRLNFNICLLVGDGIRVFANTKRRGPVFMRKIGLEWLFRLCRHPLRYWKRYVIGNPLFLYRIFKIKLSNLVRN